MESTAKIYVYIRNPHGLTEEQISEFLAQYPHTQEYVYKYMYNGLAEKSILVSITTLEAYKMKYFKKEV